MVIKRALLAVLTFDFVQAFGGGATAQSADPLPSWNNG